MALLCAAVFGRALDFGFLAFDDDINITLNPHMGPLTAGRLAWAFSDLGYVRRYVPLGWITLFLVNGASGLSPVAYHAASLVFHTLNALVVFWIVWRLLTLAVPGREPRALLGAAWIAAAWWAVHPLRVELAAWASGILNLQADFFLLLSFAAVLGGRRSIGLIAYACSVLSYPTGLGYVGALVALDAYRGERRPASIRDWCSLVVRRGPWLALAGAGAAAALFAQASSSGIWSTALHPAIGAGGHLVQVAKSLLITCSRIIAPARLSPVYDTFVDFHPGALGLAGALAACLAVAAALLLLGRKGKWGLLCLSLAFLSLLLPYLGWDSTLHSPSDRYATLASVVVAVGLGWAVAVRGATLLAGGLAAVAALGVMSARLAPVWRSDPELLGRAESLMTHREARAEIELRIARFHYLYGDFAGAERLSRSAMALLQMPPGAEPLYGAAAAKDFSEAAPLAMQHNGLGVAMARSGDLRSAEQHFRAALEVSPNFPKANVNLALLLLSKGMADEPLHCYLTVALAPQGSVDPHALRALLQRLAEAYRLRDRPDLAEALARRAASLPD